MLNFGFGNPYASDAIAIERVEQSTAMKELAEAAALVAVDNAAKTGSDLALTTDQANISIAKAGESLAHSETSRNHSVVSMEKADESTQSASASFSSAGLSDKFANENEDIMVVQNKFSSKHWAAKSESASGASAQSANTSEAASLVATEQASRVMNILAMSIALG